MRRNALIMTCLAVTLASLTPATAQDALPAPPAAAHRAVSLLPPGNSGTVTTAGQAEGSAGGSYGEDLDDQSELYWGLEGYAGQGFADPADAVRSETLLDGDVQIFWDEFGVPAIYGETGRDVWYGAGYAVAQIRLFLMDAVRRQGRGTFAELVGTPGVPMDVQTRTLTYTDEEYLGFLEAFSDEAVDAFEGYVEGANAWIAEVNADPSLLPAEYGLLSTRPEPLDVIDVLAAGVLITRTVAAEGGQEMDNVRLLRELEAELGEPAGRGVFTDLVWQDDPLAVTSVPREEGSFPSATFEGDPNAGEVFQAAADYAATLPLELAEGSGTGAHPEPQSFGSSGSDGSAAGAGDAGARAAVVESASRALADWAASLHGGSIAVAVGPGRTADDGALLLSGPQLGYSYPSLLVELEIHGGGYDARGASVPALPTVGIGYTDRVAWALTTGYSKTVDSFIETVRGPAGALEYFHDGRWKDADCRVESIAFREAAGGSLPAGPALRTEDVDVCRTVHGPIVSVQASADDGERLARSVQYQMFAREGETVEGVLAWNRAKDLEDFEAAMRLVTWNENTTYADADGHIAYWHPGIHRERPPFDQRFPMPGDGSADFGEILPFESLPQSVDPAQGFLANWNNKPAHEWLDGIGIGNTSRPGGAVQRVVNPIELVSDRDDLTFESMQDLEVESGLLDPRAGALVPLILDGLAGTAEPSLAAVRDLLAGWNRRHYDPPNAPTTFNGPGGESSIEDGTDGPGATVFEAVVEALLASVFDGVWDGRPADPDVRAACNSGTPGECPDLFNRQLGVGSHRYDMSPGHNLLLRVLDPASSGLEPSRSYLGGRTAGSVVVAAVSTALDDLAATYGSEDLADYRRPTHRSDVPNLTGAIGPSTTQPYMDRGSYIHVVGFDPIPALAQERVAGPERVATSIAASQRGFPDGASAAVVAPAGSFLEALLATPLAGALQAPLMLVGEAGSDALMAEVARLGVDEVVVVGSTDAVSVTVERQLAAVATSVTRLAPAVGSEEPADVALARAVAERLAAVRSEAEHLLAGPAVGDAYVVTSVDFPDAVAIAGVAARTGQPVVAVTDDNLDAVLALLDDLGVDQPIIVGGAAVVSSSAEAQVAAQVGGPVLRLAGPERYATSSAVLRHARSIGASLADVVLTTGANFPDSLSGGALVGALDGVLILVDGQRPDAPGAAADYARSQRASIQRVITLGGPAAVADGLSGTLG